MFRLTQMFNRVSYEKQGEDPGFENAKITGGREAVSSLPQDCPK